MATIRASDFQAKARWPLYAMYVPYLELKFVGNFKSDIVSEITTAISDGYGKLATSSVNAELK